MKRALLLILAFSSYAFAQTGPIKVHVMSARSPEGFVESTRVEDSAKDLRDILGDKSHQKYIQLVDDPDAAEIVLQVKFSGQAQAGTQTQLQKGIFGGAVATTNAQVLPTMVVAMKVPRSEYTKEFSHTQQLFWKDLARQVVKQFDSWLDANVKVMRP